VRNRHDSTVPSRSDSSARHGEQPTVGKRSLVETTFDVPAIQRRETHPGSESARHSETSEQGVGKQSFIERAFGRPKPTHDISSRAVASDAEQGIADPRASSPNAQHGAAARSIATPSRPLPHADRIQASFGAEHDVSNVEAHIDPGSTRTLGAEAYAVGNHVVFASEPDAHLAAHEAAHVVQQAQGVNLKGGVGNAGDEYEQNADAVADRVKAGQSATDLLGAGTKITSRTSPALQKKSTGGGGSGHDGADNDARATRPTNEQLVSDLLQAIDQSARAGLGLLAGSSPDLEGANRTAAQLVARIEHLISIVSVPRDVVAGLATFTHDADVALGRAEQLARELAHAGGTSEPITNALSHAATEFAAKAHWSWKPTGLGTPKVGHGLMRKEGMRIGTGTLAMVAHRARYVAGAKEPSVVKAAAQTCQQDLTNAHREISLAVTDHPELRKGLIEDVLNVGDALAALEGAAYRLGVGEDATVNSMRDSESALRGMVGLTTPRPFWDSAVPTLNAIVEVINEWHVVDRSKGAARPVWHPSQHPEVPARYRPLLDEWFLVTHGSVTQPKGPKVEIRGAMLATHIDRAITDTMALINVIQKEADPNTLTILDDFYPKVAEFRHRATEEVVDDVVEANAKDPLEHSESPIEQLSQEHQLKLASMRLMTVARALTSSAQRLTSAGKNEAKIAIEAFKEEFKGAQVPPDLQQRLESATSLADVANHISGLANGIQAVLNVADPDQRKRLLHTEFDKYGIAGGTTEILKTLGGLTQGGIAAYGIAGYSLLRARGFQVEASKLFAGASKTLSNVSTAVNVLNVVHGTLMLIEGQTTGEKVSGAVEAAWGTLGLVGRFVPRLARFTGPLSAAVLIGWTTISWIGEKAMGALYGLIQWGLNMAYDDMKTHAQEVHGEATRLAVMLEMGSSFTDPDQLAELHTRVITFTHIAASSIRSYIGRAQVPGRDRDPGTWKAFRTRFKPLADVKLDTEFDVLLAAEQFLEIVVSCFENAGQVLEESVQQSLEEHGEANKNRF
jgi:hypothetical protein